MDAFMRFALNVREIVRKDPVLVVAIVLAIISCAAVPPDAAYAEYVDLRTIGMLFSLMTIMAGLSRLGVFRIACRHLLSAVRGPRRLALALTLLAFFSSMLITNDVALVTFVPFALLALRTLDSPRHACFTVVMMTIAANLGSMLTPIGNPQNLYLYSTSHMALTDFLLLMLPYAAAALVLLVGAIAFFGRIPEHAKEKAARSVDAGNPASSSEDGSADSPATCGEADNAASAADANETPQLASDADDPAPSPLRVLPWAATFRTRPAFRRAYPPLPGNRRGNHRRGACRRPPRASACGLRAAVHVHRVLRLRGQRRPHRGGERRACPAHRWSRARRLRHREPSALECACRHLALRLHVELRCAHRGHEPRRLGTLIASMASLISYKQVALVLPREKGRYFMLFTVWNIAFLAVLAVLAAVLEVL